MVQDLITQKAAEFDRFPGLILGLDGWILRSVPKELRKQFLSGYEKLLRIVFHPDRYTDQAVKASRQNYLQVVAEAVQFMAEDEFNFELASDAVPTHSNPFVRLQNSIDIRDRIISKTNDQLEEDRDKLKETLDELSKYRTALEKLIGDVEGKERTYYLLRQHLTREIEDFPVPTGFRYHIVTGNFVKELTWGEDFTCDFLAGLDRYSSDAFCTDTCEWYVKDKWKTQLKPLLEKEVSIRFHRLTSVTGHRIMASMPLPYLCECLRHMRRFEWKDKPVSTALNRILWDPIESGERSEFWNEKVRPFTLPFYVPGSFLLIRIEGGLRLFLVKESDATREPDKAIINGLQQEISRINLAAMAKEKSSKGKRIELRGKLQTLERRCKNYQKTIERYHKRDAEAALALKKKLAKSKEA